MGPGEETSEPNHHLLDLPPEIVGMIFEYAYSRTQSVKLISRRNWDHREKDTREREGKTFKTRAFPDTTVSAFMVSRQFFWSAANAFVGSQVIEDAERYIVSPDSDSWNIIIRCVKRASVDLHYVEQLLDHNAVKLREITVYVDSSYLARSVSKFICEEELVDADFKTIATKFGIEKLAHVPKCFFRCRRSSTDSLGARMSSRNVDNFIAFARGLIADKRALMEEPIQKLMHPQEAPVDQSGAQHSIGSLLAALHTERLEHCETRNKYKVARRAAIHLSTLSPGMYEVTHGLYGNIVEKLLWESE